jgi:hypothetical protein
MGDHPMTEAAYWLAFCSARCPGSILQDPWSMSLLSEVAGPRKINQTDPNREYRPSSVGIDGWLWTFSDTSQLLVNSNHALILGDTNAP